MSDPVEQAGVWLQQYATAFGCPWAAHKPPHSLCFGLVKHLFEHEFTIDDLEGILQRMLAEKLRPKSYVWLVSVCKARIEDRAHERKAGVA